VNESRISNATEFYLFISASAAVQATTLHLFRNGEPVTVSLPVLPRKEEVPEEEAPDEGADPGIKRLSEPR
jgi:hypothetical protein